MGADAEIRTLLARIAHLADTGELDEYLTMFTNDAVWAMPENPLLDMPASSRQGQEEILAGARERRAAGVQGPGTDSRHVITTLAIDVEDAAHDGAFVLPLLRHHQHRADAAHDGSVRRRAGAG